MTARTLLFALLWVLDSLFVPAIASADAVVGAKGCAGWSDLADQAHVVGQRALTPELHEGCEPAEYDCASGSLLAAKGGGKVGGKITGYTDHGLKQAIGRDGGRGVHPEAILDSVRNPTKVIEQAGGKTKYVGKDATVILNSEGKVVTAWGRPRNPVPNQ